ncbi:LOW QUALITY PROTEIN: hypothetical protein CH63R_02484 [Colletotrichum higginsianum IMI 349063]|uniref:Uncharacterized protein n=1 Tax=Colletotrichum higginsianum (strain IMI 349063) TaxID=759273 RepID=A0A1B7YPE3_COLHI|nr:LOW QUALITY PROTEIN: hypothetical protein CH63R_02484 [Colletotrichum higginsianum IMI 349063]OBR13758.1 LOW QUALITY PROTEIN: hypothetical protein CH63R_02484 [Colletotrichum higginsianum IMI 349063]
MSGPTRERPTWSRRRVDARGDSADRMKIDLWRCVRPSSPRVGSTEAILEKTPCPETRGKARKGVRCIIWAFGGQKQNTIWLLGGKLVIRDGRGVLGREGGTYFQGEGALSGPPPPLLAEVRHRSSLRTAIARLYYIGVSTFFLYNGSPPPHPDGVVHLPTSSRQSSINTMIPQESKSD